jgi:hypothetical protein
VEADDAPCRQYIVRQREILTELTQRGGNVTEALRLLQILEELETLHVSRFNTTETKLAA